MHQLYAIDAARFDDGWFEQKEQTWNSRQEEFDGLEEKKMTEEQKEFKKRNKWRGEHVAKGICKIMVCPGILHGISHTITLMFGLLPELMDRDCRAYEMMLNNLSSYEGYVVGGDICAGIELLTKIVHELRVTLLPFLLLCL